MLVFLPSSVVDAFESVGGWFPPWWTGSPVPALAAFAALAVDVTADPGLEPATGARS